MHEGCGSGPYELRGDIGRHMALVEALGSPLCDGDGRVYVGSRYVPKRIDCDENREPVS